MGWDSGAAGVSNARTAAPFRARYRSISIAPRDAGASRAICAAGELGTNGTLTCRPPTATSFSKVKVEVGQTSFEISPVR